MLLFRLDRPLGECEIAAVLDLNLETVRIYLRSLARSGLVTRTHRYHGWILTAGGRQMVLGERAVSGYMESGNQAENIRTSAEIPSSTAEIPRWSAENPRSLPEIATNARASAENPPSTAENPRSLPAGPAGSGASAENPRSTAEIPRWSAENPPSAPLAAASLSLNSLSLKAEAAAAIPPASAENPPSTAEIPRSRSRVKPRMRKAKSEDRTANGRGDSNRIVQANLQAFASIGLVRNDFIIRICQMDHVTPAYILGQKSRLEAERRFSPGLLLRVIECKDALPEKYAICDSSLALSRGVGENSSLPLSGGAVTESVAQGASAPPLSRGAGGDSPPDPSIHEPLSASGITAAKAWSAVLRELQSDMPKSAYAKFVRNAVLLSARDGTFVIAAHSDYARDWLQGRLTSTITRLLAGICNRGIEVKFIYRD